MTGFLDRLTAHLHGEAPMVTVRPRGPFEPDPGPGPGAWPGADVTGPYDDADDEPGRHAASGPWRGQADSGSADFSLTDPGGSGPGLGDLDMTDSGLADLGLTGLGAADPGPAGRGVAVPGRGGRGLDGSGLAGLGLAGADLGNTGDPAPAGPLPDVGSRAAGPAAGWPPDGPSRPTALPGWPLAPDEGPSGPHALAASRSRRAPASTARAGAAGTSLAADGAAAVDRRPEDEVPAPALGTARPGGAVRAAPSVTLKNSFGSMAPAAEPNGEPAPPSLDELLARHVVPALRAAGAVRSGRDTVRLTQEPVTRHRGGDVHVHLGRIEVVQSPAAEPGRQARSRPRPPAPDHEAYLARRREGRR